MKKKENTTYCYQCKKDLRSEEGKNFGQKFNRKFSPKMLQPDYTCVGIVLNNGERIVGYVTPICMNCKDVLVYEDNQAAKDQIKEHLLYMLNKYATGPKGFLNKDIKIETITDLTQELKEQGVIACQ